MSNTIIFFGNERLAVGAKTSAPTLRALIKAGYKVAAVVVAQADPGKSRQEHKLAVETVAKEHNIPLLSPTNLTESATELVAYGAEAGVLIAYGKLVPQSVLDLFPKGIINVHPSLLPLHRGSAPVESVILEGASQTGVSLMKLGQQMDDGPIYSQKTVPLDGTETKLELAEQLLQAGKNMVMKHLPAIIDGSLQPTPQDHKLATYDERINKADGQINWSKPAVRLEREVRAYLGWPRSRATIGSNEVIITKARVGQGSGQAGGLLSDNKQLGVYAGEDTLIIDELIPAGKPAMSGVAWLAGYNPA